MGLLWLAIAGVVWWGVRAAIARREERQFEAAYRRDAQGIIVGAAPIHLTGTRAGAILLLHGYNDSPQAVGSVAAALHARGWTVHVPLLPGHGRTLQAFARSTADEWIESARAALAALRRDYPDVAVGGLSMGGAIAFMLAAEEPEVRAVLVFAPYVHVSRALRAAPLIAPLLTLGAAYLHAGGTRSVHDPEAAERLIAYRRSTPWLLAQLGRVARRASAILPRVQQPVLIVQSREDNRIPPEGAEAAFARIGSPDKTLHWTTGNGHVVTVDYGHEAVERYAADWLESRLP